MCTHTHTLGGKFANVAGIAQGATAGGARQPKFACIDKEKKKKENWKTENREKTATV